MSEIDTSKIGYIAARAMERVEALLEDGTLKDGSYIGAVSIVVAVDRVTPSTELSSPLQIPLETFSFVVTEPQEIYIQEGLLRLAISNNIMDTDDEDDS